MNMSENQWLIGLSCLAGQICANYCPVKDPKKKLILLWGHHKFSPSAEAFIDSKRSQSLEPPCSISRLLVQSLWLRTTLRLRNAPPSRCDKPLVKHHVMEHDGQK